MRAALSLTAAFFLLTQPVLAQNGAQSFEIEPRAPLKEIARVRAVTPFCKYVVDKASVAVDDAFDGDTRIAFLVADLSSADLDSNYFRKYQAITIMDRRYTDLRNGIIEGERAIDDLRERAATSANVEERTELTGFANALGGALSRQHKLLRDLSGLISYFQAVQDREDQLGISWTSYQIGGFNAQPGQLTYYAHVAARDFVDRARSMYEDERIAASHAGGAFRRCAAAIPDGVPSEAETKTAPSDLP
jgi:hypothetical protein